MQLHFKAISAISDSLPFTVTLYVSFVAGSFSSDKKSLHGEEEDLTRWFDIFRLAIYIQAAPIKKMTKKV